ncbi:MAG: MerC domain-containing protein [Niabella sp.]
MQFRRLKINYDRLGIFTSVACAIHCTILRLLISSLPFLGIDILENKAIEWSMILLALVFGCVSLYHGYSHHHRNYKPLLLFACGFLFLILNQIWEEVFVYLFIPLSAIFIISSHILNIYYCRTCSRKRSEKNREGVNFI